jgi:hypothetical protein
VNETKLTIANSLQNHFWMAWVRSARQWLVLFCFLLAGIAAPMSSAVAFVHPFHLCVGQMTWNSQTDRWEVSLRLHPQDLELAMTREAALANPSLGQKFSVEDADFPTNATLYINQHLFLRRTALATNLTELTAILQSEAKEDPKAGAAQKSQPDTSRSQLKWIGMEQEKGWLWIHMEMESPEWNVEREKLWMVNELLLDHVPRQENTMAVDPVRHAKFSMQFKKDQRVRELGRTR